MTHEYNRRRDSILKRLHELKRKGNSYENAVPLAQHLGRPTQEVVEDLQILETEGCVALHEAMSEVAPDVELTTRGMQRAREGVVTGPAPVQAQVFQIYAQSTINAAQTASGAVSQVITPSADLTAIQRLTADLRQAIENLAASEEEREALGAPIQQLEGELQKPKPLVAGIKSGLNAVRGLAGDAQAAWVGWERVQSLAAELSPYLQALMQALPKP